MDPRIDIPVTLQSLAPTGQARGRCGGKLVFVWGGLPGEEVSVRTIRKQRRSLHCVVTQVHKPSPSRIPPRESHYLCCSPWQIMAEEEEAAFKERMVRELFERRFAITLPAFEVVSGAFFGYRTKLEFSFADTPAGLSLAFFERGSHRRKLPIEGCLLGSPAINDAGRSLCSALQAAGLSATQLKSLVLRSNRAGQVAGSLYVTEALDRLREPLPLPPPITPLRVFFSDPRTPAAVGTSLLCAQGSPILEEAVLGRRFRFSDRSFFQVNIPLFERALLDIRSFVPAGPLYDLYAGVGTIGITVGAEKVVFVESEEETAALLRENCLLNNLRDPAILALPAEKAFTAVPPAATVILDPARAGVHPRVLRRVAASRPRRIIYLSCNPATQGQDLAALLEQYRLVFFRAYNFFPRTPHVETLAVLDRSAEAPRLDSTKARVSP